MLSSISVAVPSSVKQSTRPRSSAGSQRAHSPGKPSEFGSSGLRELNHAKLERLRLELDQVLEGENWYKAETLMHQIERLEALTDG